MTQSLGPQFGTHPSSMLPEVSPPGPPPRTWSYRSGFTRQHVGKDEMPGQGYLFRARTDAEQMGDLQRDQGRRNLEHAQRRWAQQSLHERTMRGPIGPGGAPSTHWPVPQGTTQHGNYTLAHWPGNAWGVAAFHGDQPVARLQVQHEAGRSGRRVIGYIETHPEHRRRGLATAMWHLAQHHGGELMHDTKRTTDGTAWARSVGGQVWPGGRDIKDAGR
jgi:ribosomal protein S18 acetylase RimI-like enzyme